MDDSSEEIIETVSEIKEPEVIKPLEVKIVNSPEKKKEEYDPDEDTEYDELGVTTEQVEEFENDNTSSK